MSLCVLPRQHLCYITQGTAHTVQTPKFYYVFWFHILIKTYYIPSLQYKSVYYIFRGAQHLHILHIPYSQQHFPWTPSYSFYLFLITYNNSILSLHAHIHTPLSSSLNIFPKQLYILFPLYFSLSFLPNSSSSLLELSLVISSIIQFPLLYLSTIDFF